LLTGRYHLATGMSWVTHRTEVMRSQEQTLAELLQPAGYQTGLFGKWHNGKQYPHDPVGQGFQTFVGFKDGHLANYFNQTLDSDQGPLATQGYITDALTDQAMAFMDPADPWLCMVTYNTPHSPFQVPDAYFEKYKAQGLDDRTAAIYGMVENLDWNVGRLLDHLEATGQAENTVVLFLSDNGPNGRRYNGGFKGIKASVDEGGVRVPALLRFPQRGWMGGQRDSGFMTHLDLVPTFLELAGVSETEVALHGRSLVPYLDRDSALSDRSFFTHQVIRQFDTIPGAMRTDQYLMIVHPEDTVLFDLWADPYQKNDLLPEQPERATAMMNAYQQWFADVTATGITPPPIEVGHAEAPVVELPAPEVTVREHVAFQGLEGWAWDYLTDWKAGGKVAWKIKVVQPGTFRVEAHLASETGTGTLNLLLEEQQSTTTLTQPQVKTQLPSPDRVPRGEVYEYEWPTVSLGTLSLTPGEYTLWLESPEDTDLELKSLQLIQTDE